jgi:hypothetical protein
LLVGKEYLAIIEIEKIEGRKMYFKGSISDFNGNVYSTLDTLFIKVKNLDSSVMKLVASAVLNENAREPENPQEAGMTQIYSHLNPNHSSVDSEL